MTYLILLSVGIFSVAWWPDLPSPLFILIILICSIPLWTLSKLRLPLCLMMGMLWGVFSAQMLLKDVLPEEFDGEDVLLTGTIIGLVNNNSKRSRFSFQVESAQLASDPAQQLQVSKLLLSWYGKADLRPAQRWQVVARLRRPRGFVNPSTFDYQLWLHQQGYAATGYVRDSYTANQLERSTFPAFGYFMTIPAVGRSTLRQRIVRADLSPRGKAVILALTLGDKARLSDWWQDLARLGIVHLLVISGLHIGLIALLGTLVGSGLARTIILFRRLSYCFGIGSEHIHSMPWIAPLSGLLAAFSYSLLAGFSLPTQRALIAVAVVVIARISYRKIRPLACMVWALLCIAISQPLAVLSAGFWLSFTAVGLLIWWFTPWRTTDRRFAWRRSGTAQLALLAAMSLPLLVLLGRISWLAPLVNIVAIPWVSFVTVPLALLGSALSIASEPAAQILWQWADGSIAALWWLLEVIPRGLGFMVSPLRLSSDTVFAALLASLVMLLPRGIAVRWLGLAPLVLLGIFPQPKHPLRISLLDVGQGLAVTVETQNHNLVYDSGLKYSPQFSAGSGIIAPYLWHRGVDYIDTLIISHEDGDHSGGFASLQEVLPSRRLLLGPNVEFSHRVMGDSLVSFCRPGQRWLWDGISFEILAPNTLFLEGNNSSCVLQISFHDAKGREVKILLPGDIERDAEFELLKSPRLRDPPFDLIVAPHHGSKTSSTASFVRRLAPQHVVFSAGYRHQFGHPHISVVTRYTDGGSRVWNSGEQGALVFDWLSSGTLQVSAARDQQKRWWR